MPDLTYVLAALLVVLVVDFTLRALPFAVLEPLRASEFVANMARWMPAGILVILAAITFRSSALEAGTHWWVAAAALAVTVGVHLGAGRRTLLSVGAGTLSYVLLLAWVG